LVPVLESCALLIVGAAPVEQAPMVDTRRRWTFSIEFRSIYDDNIFLSREGSEQSDLVFLVAPSVTWRAGDTAKRHDSYAVVSYTPSASFFVDESDENSLDHTVRAEMQKRFGRLAVGVDGRFQRLSGATPELSDRVDRAETAARLRLRYDVSGRTSVEVSGGYSQVDYRDAALADYEEWLVETFVGYQLSGRTRVAAGGAAGRMDVAGAGSQELYPGPVAGDHGTDGKTDSRCQRGRGIPRHERRQHHYPRIQCHRGVPTDRPDIVLGERLS
jgi:hypothetical protein